jgi:hypothetical protein
VTEGQPTGDCPARSVPDRVRHHRGKDDGHVGEDWVGGEDVLAAVGPLTTEADAQAQLALMQREIDQRAFKDERLWLIPMVPATVC